MTPQEWTETGPGSPSPWVRLAWLAIPLSLLTMAGLWVANLHTVWHLPLLFWLLAYGPATLAVWLIVLPSARVFAAQGQPSVLMLGCGMWVSALGVVGGALAASHSLDQNWAIYNSANLLSALCHFAGVALLSRGRRLGRPGPWLAAAYLGGLAAVGLLVWAAFTGRMPAFHVAGQGGTVLRAMILAATVALFLSTASLLWHAHRRRPAPFLYWYALGLTLIAAGLAGSVLIAAGDSPLQWTTRTTRAWGTVYLCLAMLGERRAHGLRPLPLAAAAQTWREYVALAWLGRRSVLAWALRYGSALALVGAAALARLALTGWFGPGLPPYLTFYPALMAAAMLSIGAALVATIASALYLTYAVLPPAGHFAVTAPADRLALVLFIGMGVVMGVIAELYRGVRDKAEAYERHALMRASEVKYHNLFNNMTEEVHVWKLLRGPGGAIRTWALVDANPPALRTWGRALGDILGRTTDEIFGPGATEHFMPVVARIMAEGVPHAYEDYFPHLDRHFRFTSVPMGDYFITTGADITDIKKIQAGLQEAQRISHLGNWEWDAATDATTGSEELLRIFGFAPGAQAMPAFAGQRGRCYPEAEWERLNAAVQAAVRTGQGYEMDLRAFRAGAPIWVSIRGEAVRDAGGRIRGLRGTIQDITERKRMEESLKEEAQRKDDFLAVLGHELRNPLAPIGNAVHLLRVAGPDPDLAARACAIIERQVAHLVRLVDDLLDVSRISRGKIQLKPETFELGEAVRGVLADYQPLLGERGLVLEAHLPAEPVLVLADQARIIQAVSNLLHNASKFTDPGGRVTVAVGVDASGQAMVRVRDSGLGIPPGQLASIFEAFRQGKDTIGRSRGGLGLGLALVKGLAALHGGQVTARSEGLGRGAEFTLTLPRTEGFGPGTPDPPGARSESGPPRRILIVEDHADSALTLQLLLQLLGHGVEVAHDGLAALAKAASFRPEIVLCDIGLPGAMGGHEVARSIRRMPGLERIHLVALTGFGTPADKALAAQAGFDAHLTKPVDPALLGPMIAGMGPAGGIPPPEPAMPVTMEAE